MCIRDRGYSPRTWRYYNPDLQTSNMVRWPLIFQKKKEFKNGNESGNKTKTNLNMETDYQYVSGYLF